MPTDLPFWQHAQWQRVARSLAEDRVPHALLLQGPAGLGKRQFAERVAALLLCETAGSGKRPCGSCRSCRLLHAGVHPDFRRLAPEEDASAIRIDAVRGLAAESVLSAASPRGRVFVIAPAETMNRAAANALLKTLEEPVPGVHLLLVSDRPEGLPATVRSRCQVLDFPVPPMQQARDWLARQLPAQDVSRLLDLAGGAPLAALALAQREEQIRTLHRDYLGFAAGRGDPVEAASRWLKVAELAELLEWSMRWTQQRLRDSCAELQSGAETLDSKVLFRRLDQLQAIKARLAHNLKPQLVLEYLMLSWMRPDPEGVETWQ